MLGFKDRQGGINIRRTRRSVTLYVHCYGECTDVCGEVYFGYLNDALTCRQWTV